MVLGFGSTEEQLRDRVKRDIEIIVEDCLNNKFQNIDDVWFSDEILKDIEVRVKQYAEESRKKEKEISAKPISDRPERYSFFYINFCGSMSDLFFGIDFSHINTRHPMSPDGMAMMSVRDCKWIRVWDFRDSILSINLVPSLTK